MAHSQHPPATEPPLQRLFDTVPSPIRLLIQYALVGAVLATLTIAFAAVLDITWAAHFVPPWFGN
ncbi:hypothetical protein G6M89_18650 [Natronolimnobius sp. AArcel1]|uniref:hypothetical protein n=1 Tax=Natronolimnobius sp. AArcel1 TaxID=1679093 RepID=UPI0013EB6ADB|nr:hypothetical protein [Natronolimnobius sp. AArcel1]NGM70999.1 hypothetical protein [Natronolimnobius sp. AArcel1]